MADPSLAFSRTGPKPVEWSHVNRDCDGGAMAWMRSQTWFWTSMGLLAALVVVVLVLPPWSPLSLTDESSRPPEVQQAAQAGEPAPSPDTLSIGPSGGMTPSPAPAAAPQEPSAPLVPPSPPATSQPAEQATAPQPPPSAVAPAATASEGRTVFPPGDIDALIAATEHPDWQVRWDAVNELGDLKDVRAVPALAKRALVDDNPHPRWRALWALSAVEADGKTAIPLFIAALEDRDPIIVRNAAVALAFFNRQEAKPELIRGLIDPDDFRRWEAVFSLRTIGDQQVAELLHSMLLHANERDVQVRGEVALALGKLGGPSSVDALLAALKGDPSPQVRWRSALSLAQRNDASIVPALEDALAAEADPQVRQTIQEALTRLRRT